MFFLVYQILKIYLCDSIYYTVVFQHTIFVQAQVLTGCLSAGAVKQTMQAGNGLCLERAWRVIGVGMCTLLIVACTISATKRNRTSIHL